MPELIQAIDWSLSRKPHFFTHIAADYYLWVTEELESDDFPVVKILYRVLAEEQVVVLLSIDEK